MCLVNKSFVFVETQKMYLLNKDVFVFVEQVIWRISTKSFHALNKSFHELNKSFHALNKSFHAFHAYQQIDEQVMPHIWINKQITYESTNRSTWRCICWYAWNDLFMCMWSPVQTPCVGMCGGTPSHAGHDSFTWGTWLVDTSNMTGAMCLCVCVCVCVRAWVCVYIFACACCVYACVCASVCGTTRLYMWDILIHKRDMIYSRICVCIRHVTHVCVCGTTHLYVWDILSLIPHEKLLGIRRVSNPSTSIDPGWLKIGFLVLLQNAGFVRDNGTNQTKEGHRGRNPVSKKLLRRHANPQDMSRIYICDNYGLASISRLLKVIGPLCRI